MIVFRNTCSKCRVFKCAIFVVILFCDVIKGLNDEELELITNDGDLPDDVLEGNYVVVEDNDVLVLTRENFNHVIMKNELILVEFYAPWCGHCQELEPEYAKAATILKEDKIPIAKVDATKEASIAQEHMVQGFPTIMLFRDGLKVENYNGERTANGIVSYIKRHNDPNWKPPASAVLVITTENFTATVKNEPLILVEFYARWCKHCQQLEPEYESAAKVLKTDYNIPLAKIDGPEEKVLADQYQVKGWPTLKVFRYGTVYEYKGGRDNKGIVEYMKEMTKLPSREVSRIAETQNSMDRYDANIIGFFSIKSDLYEEYISAANEMRGRFVFLHTFSQKLADHFKATLNTIVVFQPEIYHTKYEDKQYQFNKSSGTYKEILEFIRDKSVPLVGLRSRKNVDVKYMHRPLVVVYFDANYDHQYLTATQLVARKVVEVAKEFKNSNVMFAISNEEEFVDELKNLGLGESPEDINVGLYTDTYKYAMEPQEEFGSDTLREFVHNVHEGKMKPYLKSQPIPKKQDGPVKVIVANSFQSQIMDVKKDVLIEFYAPWCGHCKKLDPIYIKLGKGMMKDGENIIIAKMDAVANDVPPQFFVKGYPTVYFIPAFNKNDPVLYEGDMTFKDMKEFVDKQSSIFLTEEEREGKQPLEKKDEL